MLTAQIVNNRYLLQNFVVGKSNEFALAAAVQVIELSCASYNPLYIYGGIGVGKTHLIHAIANQSKLQTSQGNICYMHATTFVSNVVHAYQSNTLDEFNKYFISLDLLLIDDIQCIANKRATQQACYDLLNLLIDTNKQVIITCDTRPDEILGIEHRLISLFSGGMMVAIDPPDLEMRAAILLQKSASFGNPISSEVANYVAKHVRSDIRKLEGTLAKIEAYAQFHNRPITVDLVNDALFTAPVSNEPTDEVSTTFQN